jgi:hypothetical protein
MRPTVVTGMQVCILLLVKVSCLLAEGSVVPTEFVVKAGTVRYWTFYLSGPTRVVGAFHASGGSRNDIEAVIAEWSECENWINGNQANVY